MKVFSIALAALTLGILKDERGGEAHVTIANIFQSNGVIHVIDSVCPTELS
jgi:uncharacterized surface protein with fasciclin (FAS1) repeats